jgi:PAS domain-containing protein
MQQLRDQLAATLRDLDDTRQRLNSVQAVADGLPALQRTLDESRAENGRLFQQAGLAMFRCTRDGEVTQANRAAMTLVGRRTIDELRAAQFAAAVFEDPNGLSWLIERCLTSRTRESIETTWRRRDGGRLFVRLWAYACAPDVVEIVAEDMTRVRVLQERLAQAHRMEAVGRLGSEVAVTCGNLLTDVHQQVQQLLLNAGTSAAVRHQGEQLLADVTRAAGLMRQLYAYGEEPARTPPLADLSEVIHDLEPVLKRVAGDAVDVQLPGTSSRLNVDVGSERIERLLVNLASYGRARMPGGQLKIELGTTVVDRRFAAKHPNVRLGPHALITVTKTRNGRAAGELPARRGQPAGPAASEGPRPTIDFGTLHGLVGGCGGHLWMTLQPEGELVAKIHLPLLALPGEQAPRTLVARGGRALTRLFQH